MGYFWHRSTAVIYRPIYRRRTRTVTIVLGTAAAATALRATDADNCTVCKCVACLAAVSSSLIDVHYQSPIEFINFSKRDLINDDSSFCSASTVASVDEALGKGR